MSALSDHLLGGAATYGRRAIGAYLDDDPKDFGLFAGLAVELLLKWRLALENPAFVAAPNSFSSAVHLTRHAEDVEGLPPDIRTVTGTDAMKSVTTLVPALKALETEVKELFEHRNGEAHLGLVIEETDRKLLESLFRVVALLLPSGQVEPGDFWAPHDGFVTKVTAERADILGHEIDKRMAVARQDLNKKMRRLSPNERKAVGEVGKAHVAGWLNTPRWSGKRIACPVCRSDALVSGETKEEFSVDVDHRTKQILSASRSFNFYAEDFDCITCGLRLDTPEEMRLAGMDVEWSDWEAEDEAEEIHGPDWADMNVPEDWEWLPADDEEAQS